MLCNVLGWERPITPQVIGDVSFDRKIFTSLVIYTPLHQRCWESNTGPFHDKANNLQLSLHPLPCGTTAVALPLPSYCQ